MRSTWTVLVLIGLLSCIVCTLQAADAPPAVEVHGYMQNRVYLAPGANAEFRSERISISAKGNLPEDRVGFVELYYHPWAPASGLYLESAYFDTPLGDGRLRVGKGRRMTYAITPAYPNRKTSNYGLISEAFTMDRTQGVQYMLQKGALDFGASMHTAYRLGTRAIGEIPGDSLRNATHQVPHLCLRDLPGELSRELEFSARLGGKWQNGLKAGVSVSMGSLDGRDVTNLTSSATTNPLTPGGSPALLPATSTDDGRSTIALDFTYKRPSGMILQGEWYDSSVGDLDYAGWNLLFGWESPSGWKFFARHAKKNMDVAATANPLSWDTQQTSLSLVQPIGKALWMQYEYEINSEDPPSGIGSVSNNLFFIELFTGF